MTAQGWLAVAYSFVFLGLFSFVVPHWAPEHDTLADSVVNWWRRYRNYRKVVSDEYSRHDGTQKMITNPRRYYRLPNYAPPAIPPAVLNPWFAQPVSAPPAPGRHLKVVA